MNINELVNTAATTHSILGKRPAPSKPQPQGDDLFQALAKYLNTLHQRLCTEPPEVRAGLEIEVRVGLISLPERLERATPGIPGSGAVQIDTEVMRHHRLRFVSGVSPPVFDRVKEEVGRKYGVAERASKEIVYVYDGGQMRDQRVVMDGISPPYCERKEARHLANFQLAAAPYDLRVQASLEQRVAPEVAGLQPGSSEPPQGWSGRRTKRRFSWKSDSSMSEDEAWLWRADLTLVEEVSSQRGGMKEVREVELELLPRARDRWLSLNQPEEVIAMTSQVATHLYHLLESINPLEPLSAIANPTPEHDDGVRQAVAAACAQLKRPTGKGSSFPGAQPVNMCKRNVPDVQRGSYFIAEKTDGVRYLMMTVPGPAGSPGETCVLVDRSMNVFQVTGGGFLAGILGSGTILDGELVHNRTLHKAIFVAFDILRHRERSLVPCGFLERLDVLKKRVVADYLERVREGGAEAAPDGHLKLVPKRFFPRQKIMDLFRQVCVSVCIEVLGVLYLGWAVFLCGLFFVLLQSVRLAMYPVGCVVSTAVSSMRSSFFYRSCFTVRRISPDSATNDKQNGGRLHTAVRLVPRRDVILRYTCWLHAQVHVEGQHRIFKDSERSLHHKTDGIIFQPDAPYKVGTDPGLLKWKWVDLASVDLRVYPAAATVGSGGGGGGVRLCSEAGNHGEEVDLSRSVHLSDHDEARLVADMQNSRSVIAEVALDPGSGLWVYMGLRPDKDRPNFITTVISTMVEVRRVGSLRGFVLLVPYSWPGSSLVLLYLSYAGIVYCTF